MNFLGFLVAEAEIVDKKYMTAGLEETTKQLKTGFPTAVTDKDRQTELHTIGSLVLGVRKQINLIY